MPNDKTPTNKPEPMWRALIGDCVVAGYDFRKLTEQARKTKPPAISPAGGSVVGYVVPSSGD